MAKRTTNSGTKRSRAEMNPLKKLKSIQLKKNQKTDPTIISGGTVKPSLGRFNKRSALILALIFGGIGAYFIFFSKAATPPSANLWVDPNGGTCTRQATAGSYSDTSACGSFDAAWDAAAAGDTIVVKAGTYPRQVVTGDKTGETKIIGENGTIISGNLADCRPEFGAASVFCTEGDNLTLENITLDSGSGANQAASTRIFADTSNVTFRNVNMVGDFPALYIEGSNFKWEGGTSGNLNSGIRTCSDSYGYPVIFAGGSNITIDGVRFSPMRLQTGSGPYCGADTTPHLETMRINGGSNLIIKNSHFATGSDAGSGHIFSSVGTNGVKIVNNYFGQVNATYWIQAANSGNSNWTFLYNTFTQGSSFEASGQTWVGNLGYNQGCSGTHIKNVWSGSGACGTDTFAGSTSLGIGSDGRLYSTSPAIDAGEAPSASDYCTAADVGSRDLEGTVRPQGSACDAGADEFGSASPPPGAPTANLWVDTNGGSCTRQATAAVYSDAAACASLGAAQTAAQAGDTVVIKNGTYGAQNIAGAKASTVTYYGESKAGVIFTGTIDLESYVTLQDLTIASDAHAFLPIEPSGTNNAKLMDVDALGDYVSGPYWNMTNFSWIGGEYGDFDGTIQKRWCNLDNEPMWIGGGASNVLIEGMHFSSALPSQNNENGCPSNDNFHLEILRVDGASNNVMIRRNIIDSNGANSATIFTSNFNGGNPTNLSIIGNIIGDAPNVPIQVSGPCNTYTVAYNTMNMQGNWGSCSTLSGARIVGNLFSKVYGDPFCPFSGYVKNISQSNADSSCVGYWVSGADFSLSNLGLNSSTVTSRSSWHLTSSSAAIDRGETPSSTDLCTDPTLWGTSSPLDVDGDPRASGAACDAGADEYIGSVSPPPISDTTAPTNVVVTAPAAGSTVSNSVDFSANASDNVGVTMFDFLVDGVKVGSDSTSPYSYSWNSASVTNGTHNLTAKAYDAASNNTTSAAVSVTVSNITPVPGSGSVVAYNFEEGSGTTAADSSGNNNTLTMPSTAWTATGKNGKAAAFNGTASSFAQKADTASLDIVGNGTVEAWFKPNALGVWHGIIAKGSANDDAAHNYAIEIDNNNRIRCIIGNGANAVVVISNTALSSTSTFYHVACTWNGSTVTLYLNGAADNSTAQTLTPAGNAAALLVGLFGGSADPANGVIDDVRIYNKALTASEVSGDMNTPVSSGPSDTTPPTLPATKTITVSNITSNSVTLSWNAASDPSGVKYNVYRNNAVIATTTNTTFTDNATNSAPNAGPSPSTTYTYTIRAADNAGNVNVDTANYENKQATTLTPPPDSTPPTAFTVSLVSASTTQINISWAASSDPESGIKGYDVYRDGVKQNSSILSATTLSFGQTGSFTAGQTYVYIVKAINNSTSTDPTQTTRDSNNLSVLVPGPGSSITRYVSLSGNDANACTQSSPCRTINRAYQVATAGDTIEVAAGTNYGSQTIAFRSLPGSPVTVRPASGATITFTDLSVDTSNIVISGPNFNIRSMDVGNDGGSSTRRFDITLDNLNIDAQDTTNVDAMYIGNTQNLTLRNSKVGNTMAGPGSNDTAKSVMTCAGNSTCHNINMTFENNLFYDADAPSGSLAHLECIWAGGVQGFTLRKNTFRDCTFFDVFITVVVPNNQPQPKDHIFEDNLFGQTVHPDGYDFGYTINVHGDVQPNNFVFQRNTIEGAIATANGGGTIQAGGWKIIGNIIAGGVWLSEPEPQGCRSGIVFDYNIMPNTCGGNTTTATSTAIRGGWVAPVGPYGGIDDFHLKSTSPVINKGRPADAGTLDFDGVTRANPPEAGAYEFVSATPPPPDAPPTTNITAPDSGSTVSGSVDIFANTTDDKGLAKIEFYDNGTIMSACTKTFTSPLPTSTSTTCSWDTASASVSAGSHTLSTRAYDNVNPAVYSQNVTVTVLKTDTAPPNLPTDPTITTSNLTPTSVTLTWNASTDNAAVTCYEIYRYITSQGANSANIIKNLDNDATNAACNTTTAFSGSTTYTDLTLIANTGYSYYIKAKDAASNASASYNTTAITTPAPPDTTPPSTPTNVTATAPSSSQVNLTWSPSSDNVSVAGYNIYLNGSSTPLNGSSLVTTTSYGHNGLASNTTYSYQVEAVDTAAPTPNKSPKSTAASVTTPAPPVQTLTFSPSADAWVSQQYPTRTYGTTSQLKGDSDPNQDILINFNVSGVGTKKVKSAKLRLYVNNGSDKGGDVLMLLSTNWNESSVNFNNAPAAETTPIASLGTVSKGTTIEVDVTSKVTIDGVYGFKLSIPSTNNAIYNSKEASTNKPQLVLTLE